MANPVTCRDIVRRALRKLSRVAAGTEVTGDDLNDSLETLQAIYLELQGQGVFGRLYDVVVTDAIYTAFPQQRIMANRMGGVAITLPTLVDPAAYPGGAWWFLGSGYYDYQFRDYYCGTTPLPPHDGACIQTTDQFSNDQETWVYEASTARWIRLDGLNAGDAAPLGRFSEALASMLAQRIASEYGGSVPPAVDKAAALGIHAITHRNDGAHAPVYAEYF